VGRALTAPTDVREGGHLSLATMVESQPLAVRIAPALTELGLRRLITWTEAAFVIDAVEYFDAREAARWRRTEELIAEAQRR